MYFCILGDPSSGSREVEEKDEEIKKTGITEIEKLNKKYKKDGVPRFNFIYRKRIWNEKEKCYLGWERKRGLLTELNTYLMKEKIETNAKSNILPSEKPRENTFIVNTIEDFKIKNKNEKLDIKYIITLDSDTSLSLNSGIELIEAMSHPLNKPVVDEEKKVVVDGFGIIQPRIGIELETSFKTVFTQIFAGDRRSRFIYKCNFKHLSR